jgi:toxin ParE1/3/4
MSSHSRGLRLTGEARRDVRSILSYTRGQWGHEQRRAYSRQLEDAFTLIRDNPLIGIPREDLGPSLRSRLMGHHIIYYQVQVGGVRIVRVMHERTNPLPHLVRQEEEA